MESTLNRYSSITDLISRSNLAEGDLEIQIFKRRPVQEEQVLLQTDKQDWVFIVDRIRAADGEPIVYSQNILLQSIVGTISRTGSSPDHFPGISNKVTASRYLKH
ncbi:hypothetical protein LJK88_37115 [Paenibacillus sp. P26]|nr:hypothetical protein LJK88_37115 [Paenibacillus sp. P26]